MTLDTFSPNIAAIIDGINWHNLKENEAHRLRSFGFEEGASIYVRHRGILFWRDPIVVQIGRMTIALRAKTARHIMLRPAENQDIGHG
ncbi:hypothetical protein LPB140_01620 [Sphingorhabdus lutea]|uniref:Ferrous iron transporter FeoA-like domain-containing protein n=1 Tax=Sphingorhabdus lutea TaxID=1913578 RepID=A0A1L3J9H7_9SPHN|nr:FeoA family protein [Sphingorhabdus lutea]APG61743.1 hypothetical protein LPB140_01620 [Sphingorhabdus lutea]